jgi:hypothetical protein
MRLANRFPKMAADSIAIGILPQPSRHGKHRLLPLLAMGYNCDSASGFPAKIPRNPEPTNDGSHRHIRDETRVTSVSWRASSATC